LIGHLDETLLYIHLLFSSVCLMRRNMRKVFPEPYHNVQCVALIKATSYCCVMLS